MTDVRNVIGALQTYIQRATDEREARNAHDGYSWDWHGRALISEVEEARETLTNELNAYIDERIDARVAKAVAKAFARNA